MYNKKQFPPFDQPPLYTHFCYLALEMPYPSITSGTERQSYRRVNLRFLEKVNSYVLWKADFLENFSKNAENLLQRQSPWKSSWAACCLVRMRHRPGLLPDSWCRSRMLTKTSLTVTLFHGLVSPQGGFCSQAKLKVTFLSLWLPPLLPVWEEQPVLAPLMLIGFNPLQKIDQH